MAEKTPEPANKLLLAFGCVLLAAGLLALFFGKNEAIGGGALILGVALVLFGVFYPRLEGTQKIGFTVLEINLASRSAILKQGERELSQEQLPELGDVE